jgi:hypothetical protein
LFCIALTALLLHKKLYGAVPPITFANAVPLLFPHKAGFVSIVATNNGGCVNAVLAIVVQALLLLTVTE